MRLTWATDRRRDAFSLRSRVSYASSRSRLLTCNAFAQRWRSHESGDLKTQSAALAQADFSVCAGSPGSQTLTTA